MCISLMLLVVKFIQKNFSVSEFVEVNEALYEWYCLACSKNIHPGGPELTKRQERLLST